MCDLIDFNIMPMFRPFSHPYLLSLIVHHLLDHSPDKKLIIEISLKYSFMIIIAEIISK